MSAPRRGQAGRGLPYNQQLQQNQQNIPGYAPASVGTYNHYDRRYHPQPPQAQLHAPNYHAYPNVQCVETYSVTPVQGPLTPPSESPSPFPGYETGYYGRQRTGSQSSGSEFMPSEIGREDQQRLMQPPSEFSGYEGQGAYFMYGSEKELPSPGPSKHPNKRRHGQGPERQAKHWKGARGRDAEDTYCLTPLPKEGNMPEYIPGAMPQATLMGDEYKDVFQQLNERVCRSTYDWLAQYKFRIPMNKSMKDHKAPEDRELTEYVQIVKKLIEGREVPNHAVRDERIKEVISIMEGAAEIRHVTIHVSRKQKPDRRVLGFISAVAEYCWILGDDRGTMETNNLYARIEDKTRKRQEESTRVAAPDEKSPPKSS